VILVLRALGIGDLATAVPALRGLRRAARDQQVWLAAPAGLVPLVDLVGGVDRLVPVAGLEPVRWPVPEGQVAVNLHGRGPQSHRLLARAEPGRMLAFACPAAGQPTGPRWRDDEHEVHRWCRLLHWYGVPADPDELELRRPGATVATGVTIVHPGAKSPERRWPPQRFAAVAGALAARGHRVVVTGSGRERDLAAQVTARAGLPASAVLAGRTGLADLAALVAHARLLISGDTGVAHLATSFGTPSVLLFGPTPPGRWGPPPDRRSHRALWHGDAWHGDAWHGDAWHGDAWHGDAWHGAPGPAGGGSHPPAPHPALAEISAEEVLTAAYQVMPGPARR
jgi:ADP-heptose:LPS heptosyltransferase